MAHPKFQRFLPGALAVLLLLTTSGTAFAQGVGTVRGTVVDGTTRRPVDAAQVLVPGTDFGTVTNSSGQFELNLAAGPYRLTVRRVGYRTTTEQLTVTAGQVTEIEFNMVVVAFSLDEVVVTGTGVATEKKMLGNTIATIDATALQDAPVRTFSEILTARTPGVSVTANGGLAGEGASIRIRGSASLSQSNEPIIYVDGIRVDRGGGFGATGNVSAGGAGVSSRLDDINPESIERIEILKGPAAATLYGTEASNGVIQIFTKRGSRGPPRFDFSLQQGFSRFDDSRLQDNWGFAGGLCDLSLFTAIECRDRDAAQATAVNSFYGINVTPFELFSRPTFRDEFETGTNNTLSASISGGTSAVTYYVSGRYAREDGPWGAEDLGPARDFDRKVQATVNLDFLPTDKLRFRISTQFSDVHHESPENGNNINGVNILLAAHPELASCFDGSATGDGRCGDDRQGVGNPTGQPFGSTLREMMQRTVAQDVRHYTASLKGTYTPTDELSIDATFGVDNTSFLANNNVPFGWNVDGFASSDVAGARALANVDRRELTFEAKATWSRNFGDRITSALVVGGQGFIARAQESGGTSEEFPGPGLEVLSAGAIQITDETFLEVVNAGAFVQEQVGWNEWIFGTVGARFDRNSAFGESEGSAFYPKASLSLVLSDRDSWASNTFSTLRVRGAIGQSGLQPGAFDKFTTFSPITSALGPGLQPDNLGNQDLKPERSTEWEVGAELGLFDDRYGIDLTYWNRTTRDALFLRQFTPSGGFVNQQLDNVGRIESKGVEIGLNGLVVNNPTITVQLWANAAYIDELVADLGGAAPVKTGGAYIRYRNFLEVGFAPGSFLGAKLREVGPGLVPVDTNGDGQPDTEAEVLAYLATARGAGDPLLAPLLADDDGDGDVLDNFLGKPTPDWQGAFGTDITLWRNLKVATLFEYKAGNYFVHNLIDAFRETGFGRNTEDAVRVSSVLSNPASTAAERLDQLNVQLFELNHLAPRSGLNAVENAKFLRWRELSFSYSLPTRWVRSKLGFRYMSLNASVRNLKMWTGYPGADPEGNVIGRGGEVGLLSSTDNNFLRGVDMTAFPMARRFTFGVRFGF